MTFHVTEAISYLNYRADDEIVGAATAKEYTPEQIKAIYEHPWTGPRVKIKLFQLIQGS